MIGGDDDNPVAELILGQRHPIRLAKIASNFRIRTTRRAARVLLRVHLLDPDMPTTDTHAKRRPTPCPTPTWFCSRARLGILCPS